MTWPITIRAPLMVAALMVFVGVLLSRELLVRLASAQEDHLKALSAAYLDGVSSAVLPHAIREDVWEVFDALNRASSRYESVNALTTVVVNSGNRVVAASDPKRFRTGELLALWDAKFSASGRDFVIDARMARANAVRTLSVQGQKIGRIYTELDIAQLLQERRTLLWQLILTNTGLTLGLAAIGYVAMLWIVRPVQILGDHLERAVDGQIRPIEEAALGHLDSQFGQLFRRYNAVAVAANEREALRARLAEEEKLASIGRLASGMAHEINNPLGGMFNALDALKRYGDRETVRATSTRLLETGLRGIRHVVRATLMNYRGTSQMSDLEASDLEDLRFLIQSAVRQKALDLNWDNQIKRPLKTQVSAVRQSALNLLLNACAVAPHNTTVGFRAEEIDACLEVTVRDQGPGLGAEYKRYIETGREPLAVIGEGKGLGLWMVRKLMVEVGGSVKVETSAMEGTSIRLNFPIANQDAIHAG